MEPTEHNRRAWDEVHRRRAAAMAGQLGLPAVVRSALGDLKRKRVLHLQCATGESTAQLAELRGVFTSLYLHGELRGCVGLVLPKDYTLAFSRIAFISKTARNPNAAKLFLDYILSKRGQTVMSEKSLVYSIRSDVPGQITAAGLNKDLGKAIKPIEVNTDILAGLEQTKRLEFMKQWKEALKR